MRLAHQPDNTPPESSDADAETKPVKKPGRVRKALSWSFKPFVNIFAMAGISTLAQNARQISTVAKRFVIPAKSAKNPETFEQAIQRLQLSDEELKQRETSFLRLAITFLVLSILIFAYSLYVAWFGRASSFLLALVVGLLSLAFTFRYHFWWFQIKQRKLGCTLQDWFNGTFREEDK